LAAAITAAQAGLRVTLIDESPRPGGQYLRGTGRQATQSIPRAEQRTRAFLQQLPHPHIDLQTGTLVWGIDDRTLALHGPNGNFNLQAEQIIIATGGRELVPPFPGWTLPGVMTLGAAQILTKEYGLLPGKRIALAGSGPLLLAAASALLAKDARIIAILEATHPGAWLPHVNALWGNFNRLLEGNAYLRTIQRHKIPYRFGQTVIQATGKGQLEYIVTAKLDPRGRPVPGSEKEIAADTLCLGFGLIPNTELAQLAECQHEYSTTRGGWVPARDKYLQTSQPGIYAVGEAAGVGGADMALMEGQIAALAITRRFNQIPALQRQLRPLRRFAVMLNTLFAPPLALNTLASDETIICRCQEVRAGEIRQAVRQGNHTLGGLKNSIHIGQGQCQGRTCGPLLTRLIASQTHEPPEAAGQFRPRPPLKPISLGALAQEQRP
jgi:NADPH-dependent 2,4-dienoyl-CoA reductase/sulfur reductase-like enzyme